MHAHELLVRCRAVADVVADVCSPDWHGSPVKATEAVYGWASAYAQVRPPPASPRSRPP